MADPNFFARARAFKAAELAEITGAVLAAGNADLLLEDVAPLDKAGAADLSFLDNVKYKDQFRASKAGACFIHESMADQAPKGMALLVSAAPYKSYALAAQAFYPETLSESSISPQALIDPSANIGKGCVIEAGVIIGANAKIGPQCRIEAGVVIGPGVQIGSQCRIGVHSSVSHALIGDHVRLYPGCRVGQDGFGFAIDPSGYIKVPQLGRVVIEDHVEIGANTTIDRGSGPDTVIGQGTWIDNLVQIAHNVKIGKGCIIVAQVGIAGSTIIEDYVAIGGQVGITGHLHIGKGARIAAKSGVIQDVPAGEEQMGYPSQPKRQFLKQVALLKRLIKKDNT